MKVTRIGDSVTGRARLYRIDHGDHRDIPCLKDGPKRGTCRFTASACPLEKVSPLENRKTCPKSGHCLSVEHATKRSRPPTLVSNYLPRGSYRTTHIGGGLGMTAVTAPVGSQNSSAGPRFAEFRKWLQRSRRFSPCVAMVGGSETSECADPGKPDNLTPGTFRFPTLHCDEC